MKYVQVLIFTVQSQLFETPNSLNKLIVVLNSLGLLQSDFYLQSYFWNKIMFPFEVKNNYWYSTVVIYISL